MVYFELDLIPTNTCFTYIIIPWYLKFVSNIIDKNVRHYTYSSKII